MKSQRSDDVLRGGSGHVSLEPPKWVTRTETEERWPELAADTWPCSDGLEAVKEALRVRAGNSRVDASVALLRAMDREPRSYLVEALRAFHAGAEREELGDLLREAFGESTDYQPALTRRALSIPPEGAFCAHTKMTECHPGCGHFSCPCGVYWDEGSEGP